MAKTNTETDQTVRQLTKEEEWLRNIEETRAKENGPKCRNCGRYLSGHANYNYCFSWGNEKFEPIEAVRP